MVLELKVEDLAYWKWMLAITASLAMGCSGADQGSTRGGDFGPVGGGLLMTGGIPASGGDTIPNTGGASVATGGIIPGLGGGSGGKSGGDVLGDACASDTYEAEERPVTIYTLFDDSGSMIPWWLPVTDAFIQFTKDPASAGINIGLKFFGSECAADFYANPDVPIAALPGNATAIETTLTTRLPFSGTATTPALEGALMAAQARAQQFPEEKVIILLVTDGSPSNCGADINNASAAAANAFNAGFPVYALGLGNIGGLNSLSQSGGTGDALAADPNMVDLVVKAMNEIRGRALPCDYALPPGGEGMQGFINLVYDDGAGGGGTIPAIQDATMCDGMRGGWYFDDSRTRLIACPETCTALKSGAAQTVNVVLGCPTVVLE